MKKFHGTGVALVTPFNADRSVDYDGLKNLINYLIDGKVEYLVSLGTTGEASTLNKEEKKKIWEFTAEINGGRVPLVAGIGGNDTAEVVHSIRSFNAIGYDGILSASPYYNKPTQEGIYQHYKAVSEATELPIILYNVPGRTASNMTAETTCRLATDFSNVVAVKEASGNFDQFNQIMRDKPEHFMLISGDDPIALPMISLGAVGVISVVGNALPESFSRMIRLCLEGNYSEALPIHLDLIDFTRMIFAEGNPAGVKAALKHYGVCADHVRLPLVSVSEGLRASIVGELADRLKVVV
ncbi:4-hydroxy-tetrahydrodipicolinate synthase [Pedobacter deserti]|uniref:4-hydroxy-tetrahydrodipicolinate synthase n=1 Tax=Pedobacter deserti TaxID=2817382 RepID=UPI002109BBD2|nr:4-hydroxy-tetrahydrodipicolinate synthase [Pedobacter sp. SYSU D00382]